jgi:hypothetical protein
VDCGRHIKFFSLGTLPGVGGTLAAANNELKAATHEVGAFVRSIASTVVCSKAHPLRAGQAHPLVSPPTTENDTHEAGVRTKANVQYLIADLRF